GRFDVIVATNVLHATADLARTLANVRALLNPGGMLLLLEGTSPRYWLDVTFGLTEGWWTFADSPVRERYPLLAPESWKSALHEAGYDEVAWTTAPGSHLMPQALLVARAAPVQRDLPARNVPSTPGAT